jgi:DNA-binding NtrC family response regulator
LQKKVEAISPDAMNQLLCYSWPGNVRELENRIQQAIAMATESTIKQFRLGSVVPQTPSVTSPSMRSIPIAVGTTLAEAEEKLTAATLDHCGGNKEKAAKLLGVSARTLYRRAGEPSSENKEAKP